MVLRVRSLNKVFIFLKFSVTVFTCGLPFPANHPWKVFFDKFPALVATHAQSLWPGADFKVFNFSFDFLYFDPAKGNSLFSCSISFTFFPSAVHSQKDCNNNKGEQDSRQSF